MQTRRSFFSRLGALVAVVALAPQIAFAIKPRELFQNIVPSIVVPYENCGSLTMASVTHLSPDELRALFTPRGLFSNPELSTIA